MIPRLLDNVPTLGPSARGNSSTPNQEFGQNEVKLPTGRIEDIRLQPWYQPRSTSQTHNQTRDSKTTGNEKTSRNNWSNFQNRSKNSSQGYRPSGQSYLSDRESRNQDFRLQRTNPSKRCEVPYQYPPGDEPTPPPKKATAYNGVIGGYNHGNSKPPEASGPDKTSFKTGKLFKLYPRPKTPLSKTF